MTDNESDETRATYEEILLMYSSAAKREADRAERAEMEIARLTADRDAWQDALRHVACRLGGTGEGSPDDVRRACDDLAAQDDDLIADGEDYQRERDELLALVREHFAAEAARADLSARLDRLYDRLTTLTPEAQELGRAHDAAVARAEEARAALLAKVTP